MDLVRDMLLHIEKFSTGNEGILLEQSEFSEFSEGEIYAHKRLLEDAGFLHVDTDLMIEAADSHGITWLGYDFLDSIRSPEVWKKTKEAADAAGGWSVRLLGRLAEGYLKTKIKNATGIELS
jgi:hypothetical protein